MSAPRVDIERRLNQIRRRHTRAENRPYSTDERVLDRRLASNQRLVRYMELIRNHLREVVQQVTSDLVLTPLPAHEWREEDSTE